MSDLEAIVLAGDPDRHAASLAAPAASRAKLWPLYAFNLEIARAPWVTQEPLIAEMRLQFWADVLEGIAADAAPRAHEVAAPLAQVWRDAELPVDLGQAMVAARRRDIARAPFADAADLLGYIEATSGNLMWLAARALGAGPGAEARVRGVAAASGLANWLRAVPELQARGWAALPDPSDAGIAALAREGLARLNAARSARRSVPACAHPALLAGWQAGPVLRRALARPGLVRDGGLEMSEFARRGQLLLRALSGRW